MISPDVESKAAPRLKWILAIGITIAIVCLHFFFLNHAGGFWRDEINHQSGGQPFLGRHAVGFTRQGDELPVRWPPTT
jgi:hypothetical protein